MTSLSSPKSIQEVIRNVPQHWVGDGFPVRSLFSYADGNRFDPFLLLDHAGPHRFEPSSQKRGVGEHPHRGFETVTIVYDGELEHRDSSGSHGSIGPGDVQWMTAASGVVHEEFHSQKMTEQGGSLEMVQLWVNLPAKLKMSKPRYQSIVDAQIPRHALGEAGYVRVIAGAYQGTQGAAMTHSPIEAWDIRMQRSADVELPIPASFNALLLVQQGTLHVAGESFHSGELIRLSREGDHLTVRVDGGSQVLVLAGKPLDEPVAGYGPFVMNTREEIQQAIDDYRAGRMGHLVD
ncbi:MAG: pirin family protein [Pirellulales bacterium]